LAVTHTKRTRMAICAGTVNSINGAREDMIDTSRTARCSLTECCLSKT
jgi:hypothetical protein